ncbi:hypothetical protein QJS66_08680 [Kocuria rhizophila]|nr:hypothetical protein QJS66_08680 [Kocuria rhizophila]
MVIVAPAARPRMRAAVEVRSARARTDQALPHPLPHGRGAGGVCAALANVGGQLGVAPPDTVKGGDYLVDRRRRGRGQEAVDRGLDLEHIGSALQPHARGQDRPARFGGHTRDHGKSPVRRACVRRGPRRAT